MEAFVAKLGGVVINHRARRSKAEMRHSTVGRAAHPRHGASRDSVGAHRRAHICERLNGNRIDIGIGMNRLEPCAQRGGGTCPGTKRADLVEEEALVLRTGYVD